MGWNIIFILLSVLMLAFYAWQLYDSVKHRKKQWIMALIASFGISLIFSAIAFFTKTQLDAAATAFVALLPAFVFSADAFLSRKRKSLFMDTVQKITVDSLYIVLIDIFSIALLYLAFLLWSSLATNITMQLSSVNLQAVSAENAGAIASTLQALVFYLISSIVLFLLIVFAVFHVSQHFVWNLVSGSRFSVKCLFKLCLLDLIWLLIWSLPGGLIFLVLYVLKKLSTETSAGMLIAVYAVGFFLFLLFLYLTILLHASFARTKSLRAVGSAFYLGFAKIQYFIMPVLYAIALFIIINTVFFVPLQLLTARWLVIMAYLVAMLFYLAFLRYYFFDTVGHSAKQI